MSELERINVVKESQGDKAAMDFAERTMKTYRRAVLHSSKRGKEKPHFASTQVWRETFIRSYLELKRYVLANRPDALLTPEERQAKIEAAKAEYAREQARIRLQALMSNVQAGMVSREQKLKALKCAGSSDSLIPDNIDLASAEGRDYVFQRYGISYLELSDRNQIRMSAPFIVGEVCGNVGMYANPEQCIKDLIMRTLLIGSAAKKI